MSGSKLLSCPKCGSTDCRESRWRSHQEKTDNPGRHPYRCLTCAHRFVAARAGALASRRGLTLAAAVVVLIALSLVAGGTAWMLADDDGTHPLAANGPDGGAGSASGNETGPSVEAAQSGDLEAQYRLGRAALLNTARGKEATLEALGWLKRASEGGHTGAMILLGKLYRSGVGITQNYELAARWIAAAAEAGDPEGMVEYGRLHRSGIGMTQDAVMAYVWFNRAAAALNMEGVHERDSVAIKLTPEELKRAQALSLELEEALAEGAQAGEKDAAASSLASGGN
ncbi:sel1 repeat family protein [Thauera sp.]|uniref:sel1 repeat family protein n=1 Tax=Thauera sp. TaxID=1905334 RepID=UPI002BABBB0E|nr:sel1 repeat family protein [Thauera sp.]HRP24537.1 sel1 repeat family protein [Thauera sp.]